MKVSFAPLGRKGGKDGFRMGSNFCEYGSLIFGGTLFHQQKRKRTRFVDRYGHKMDGSIKTANSFSIKDLHNAMHSKIAWMTKKNT